MSFIKLWAHPGSAIHTSTAFRFPPKPPPDPPVAFTSRVCFSAECGTRNTFAVHLYLYRERSGWTNPKVGEFAEQPVNQSKKRLASAKSNLSTTAGCLRTYKSPSVKTSAPYISCFHFVQRLATFFITDDKTQVAKRGVWVILNR